MRDFVKNVAHAVISQSEKITSDREKRENNIIIAHIPESDSESSEERIKHDQKHQQSNNPCHVEIQLD